MHCQAKIDRKYVTIIKSIFVTRRPFRSISARAANQPGCASRGLRNLFSDNSVEIFIHEACLVKVFLCSVLACAVQVSREVGSARRRAPALVELSSCRRLYRRFPPNKSLPRAYVNPVAQFAQLVPYLEPKSGSCHITPV